MIILRKKVFEILNKNICIFIMTIFATITVIMNIYGALILIKGGGTLNDVQYSLFSFKLDMIRDGYGYKREIFKYPLIPIGFGILYNSYLMFKNRKTNEC
jgi:hypothetical protein